MKGIRKTASGFRAYVKVHTEQREKRFKPETPFRTIKEWRDETRVELRKKYPRLASGTLKADVERYLALVKAMPTHDERERHLKIWIDALGATTPRATITPEQIRKVLQHWRAAKLEPATCNKRRTALMHLWSVLDGKGALNPVRDVPKFRVADPLPRGRDPHTIDAKLLLAPPCRSRACCRVLLWTGMRPAELNRAEESDLDRKAKTVIVRTAKGGRVRVVPLSSQALSAWDEFDAADCWQDVPQAAPLNRWLQKITGTDDLRVYDLRHSYATALAARNTRLDVIGYLLGHSTLELSRRYTLAAVKDSARLATAKLEAG